MHPVETRDYQALIHQLNACYEQHSHCQSSLKTNQFEKERWWWLYIKSGFNEADLIAVIHHLKGQIRIGRRKPASLKLSNLIGHIGCFEEELNAYRLSRDKSKLKPTARDEVLAQAGRPKELPLSVKGSRETCVNVLQSMLNQLQQPA